VNFKSTLTLTAVLVLIIFTAQMATAFDPAHTLIVYDGGTGDYYDCIEDAVDDAVAGDVIVIYPGTYTDTEVDIDVKIDFVGVGNVKWSGADTLFVLSEDDVTFKGITFETDGSFCLTNFQNYRYFMKQCTVRCEAFNFGRDTSHWEECHFYPKTTDGWVIDTAQEGDVPIIQWRDCKLGDDIPINTELTCGINVKNNATLAAYYCGFYSDSTAIYCLHGRLRIYYSMFIGTDGPAVKAEGESKLSFLYTSLECDDDVYSSATLEVLDESEAHLNNCIVRNMVGNQSVYTQTEGEILVIDSNFKDDLYFDEPSATTAGDVKLIGYNSINLGGIDDQTGATSTMYGSIVNMHAYGEAAFVDDNPSVAVTVNGIPANAVVNVTYKKDAIVHGGDTVMAVEVDADGSQFFVRRSGTSNTDDLGFSWTAEWEAEYVAP